MAASTASGSRGGRTTTKHPAAVTRGGGARAGAATPAAKDRRAPAAPAVEGERKLPRKKPSPGISRVDQEATRTHGYAARVGYAKTDAGWRPRHTAFFGDRSHGSPAKALKAAEEWVLLRREDDEKIARRARGGRAEKAGK